MLAVGLQDISDGGEHVLRQRKKAINFSGMWSARLAVILHLCTGDALLMLLTGEHELQ